MSKHKILVTGGLGYIGSHTVVELLDNDFDVIIVDDLSNSQEETLQRIETITNKKARLYIQDLSKENSLDEILKKEKNITGVIHFAAYKSVGESCTKPLEYYRNNINTTLQVLFGIQKYNIPYMIFSSSASVYGVPEKLPVTEEEPPKEASSPYGNTKQIGEEMLKDFTLSNPTFSILALRYFNPMGAHKSALIGEIPSGIPNNLLPYLTQTAAGIRKELKVFGSDYDTPDGTGVRDYLHVVDLARAHVKALEYLIGKQNTKSFDIFNLGTGRGYSVLEVIKTFEKVTGKKVKYTFAPRRDGDIDKIWADPSKAEKLLGWKAELGLDSMLSSSWKWEEGLRK